jgi:putative nucleotidyltransferase with HDIG domain
MARDRRRADEARWERRWFAGLAVRAVVTLVPFSLAVATVVAAGRTVPRPAGAWVALWYTGICGSSWVVMWLAHRWLHRYLPLAGLLEMSLLFPERAPSRLSLARRVATKRDLAELHAGRDPHGESTQEAAERILALVSALSEHDRGTRGHSERVRALTDLIAMRMGLTQHDRDRLRWAALLHDIGKLKVPTTLLNKPAGPTPVEWEVLRRHPHHGAEMVSPLLAWLGEWGQVVVQHHEKWDGSGYPQGLAGPQICLGARIVTVADAYDVMTAARAYKKPTGRAAALRELVACSGRHFDPEVVRALISTPQRQVLLTMGPLAWVTGLPFVGQTPGALGAALTSQTTVAAGAIALTGTAALSTMAPADAAPQHPTAHIAVQAMTRTASHHKAHPHHVARTQRSGTSAVTSAGAVSARAEATSIPSTAAAPSSAPATAEPTSAPAPAPGTRSQNPGSDPSPASGSQTGPTTPTRTSTPKATISPSRTGASPSRSDTLPPGWNKGLKKGWTRGSGRSRK